MVEFVFVISVFSCFFVAASVIFTSVRIYYMNRLEDACCDKQIPSPAELNTIDCQGGQ